MQKIIISGIELTIDSYNQILGMGGPWIGSVSIGTDFISKDCLIDNFVYKEDMNLLFFVKFQLVSKYSWYFSINFYNINSKTIYEFDRTFNMVYLGEFRSKNELEIYPAFHDSFKNTQIIFNLDEEEFSQIPQ